MKQYHITIKRQNSQGNKWDQQYNVEVSDNEVISVMNILDIIYQTQDATLAYFDHAACGQAACGRCLMRINGKIGLACKEIAQTEMLLEPANGNVVRDLICKL